MYIDIDFPPPAGPLARFERIIRSLDRPSVELAVELLIAHLDADDGDPDLEDSEAGEHLVDNRGRRLDYATLADEFPADSADGGDVAYIEWDTRRFGHVDRRGAERLALDQYGNGLHEDAEDDDPAEDADNDRCAAGDDHMIAGPVAARDQWERYDQRTGAQIGDDADAEDRLQVAIH